MKLGVNLLYLSHNTNSGSGKYTEALLTGLRKVGLLKGCVLFVRKSFLDSAQKTFPECFVVPLTLPPLIETLFLKSHRHQNFWESLLLNRFRLSKAVSDAKVSLLLHPFNECTLALVNQVPNVVVIHDLFYLRHPEYYRGLLYPYATYKHKRFLSKASAVVTVSESIHNLLLEQFAIAKDARIHTITNIVGHEFSFSNDILVDTPYLLCIGSLTHHHNTMTLLHAYNLIKKRIPHQLVLVGKHLDEFSTISGYLHTHNLKDRVLCLSDISNENRNNLYRHASLVIFPATSENFGRVPIEAALLKAPVLISDLPSLRETTLNLLDSYAPAEDALLLASKIMNLLKNPPSLKQRTEIACTYETLYNDEIAAKKFKKLFSLLLNNK